MHCIEKLKLFSRSIYGRDRKLTPAWFKEHPWLRYSVSTDALYCGYCVLFSNKEAKDKLFINPVTDWVNLSKYVTRHEKPNTSHASSVIAGENFERVKSGKSESIVSKVSSSHREQVKRNRHILDMIIKTLLLCAKQNIAIRGHVEEKSNFIAILREFADDDQILMEHLNNKNARYKYTSPDIQNELLSMCGKQISDQIVNDCNRAVCFAVMADECTDKSVKEQLSICLRFVEFENGKVKIREDFLCFVEPDNVKGETIARLLLETLEREGINVEKMRAQGYDGASNMSGKFRGVQAIVKERIPLANYVHCKAHQLNLSLVHSSSEPCVRTMMATVQDIAFAFSYSAKRLNAFADKLEADDNVKEDMERRTKLKTLCETRWFSRADALYTFKTAFPVVVHSLEHLKDNNDDKAGLKKT